MKGITVVALSLGLASAPLAFAEQAKPAQGKPQAVKMSDAQLDNVTAGALINAVVVDVVDVNNNNIAVAVPVNAAVAVNVLGGATGAAALQQPGRILQAQ
jgi:hypothetical protein